MRLFLGSFLDKELVEKILFDVIQKFFKGDLKPIKQENVHMTWIFFGNVEENNIEVVSKVIDNHQDIFKGLNFCSKSLELWPPKKSPRLIVLSGTLNKQINLKSLTQDLKTICSPDEKDNFLPHITVSRFKKDKTIDKNIELPKIENFTWQIKEISLIESILSSEGPSYKKIKTWQLL